MLDIIKQILYTEIRNKQERHEKGAVQMKDISTIRKTVAVMANQLHKLGYSLSQAFKTAWKRVKNSMKCRVSGVTYISKHCAYYYS